MSIPLRPPQRSPTPLEDDWYDEPDPRRKEVLGWVKLEVFGVHASAIAARPARAQMTGETREEMVNTALYQIGIASSFRVRICRVFGEVAGSMTTTPFLLISWRYQALFHPPPRQQLHHHISNFTATTTNQLSCQRTCHTYSNKQSNLDSTPS